MSYAKDHPDHPWVAHKSGRPRQKRVRSSFSLDAEDVAQLRRIADMESQRLGFHVSMIDAIRMLMAERLRPKGPF